MLNPQTCASWIPGSVHPELVAKISKLLPNLTQPCIKATAVHELTTHWDQALFQRCKAGEESESLLTEFATEVTEFISWRKEWDRLNIYPDLKISEKNGSRETLSRLGKKLLQRLTAPRVSGWRTWMLPTGPRTSRYLSLPLLKQGSCSQCNREKVNRESYSQGKKSKCPSFNGMIVCVGNPKNSAEEKINKSAAGGCVWWASRDKGSCISYIAVDILRIKTPNHCSFQWSSLIYVQ